MEQTKHTPERWAAKDGQIYVESTGQTIAILPYFDPENEQQAANEKLLAAAPEMLEALQDYLRIMQSRPTDTNQYQRNKIENLIYNINN